MRRLIAGAVTATLLLTTWIPAAHAGKSTDIALGLASFAVFNQIVAPLFKARHAEAVYHRREVVYSSASPPPVVYQAPVVVTPPPPPPPPATVVQYPHGRYELQVQGYQYVWVWIPNVPPPPPPPPTP